MYYWSSAGASSASSPLVRAYLGISGSGRQNQSLLGARSIWAPFLPSGLLQSFFRTAVAASCKHKGATNFFPSLSCSSTAQKKTPAASATSVKERSNYSGRYLVMYRPRKK